MHNQEYLPIISNRFTQSFLCLETVAAESLELFHELNNRACLLMCPTPRVLVSNFFGPMRQEKLKEKS